MIRAKNLTVRQVTLRAAAIMVGVELCVMLVIGALPWEVGLFATAWLDALLLAIISTPLIYVFLIKPFVLARDQAVAELTHLALHDPLTKLANRRLFMEQFKRDLAFACRHGAYGGLLMIDLDDFKQINDTLGHDCGDKILVEVAARLSRESRPEDLVVRLGGDEFVLLLPQFGVDSTTVDLELLRVAERLQQMIFEPIRVNGHQFQIGCSIGICRFGDRQASVEELMDQVDRAMYQAKKTGKGRITFFQRAAPAPAVSDVAAG